MKLTRRGLLAALPLAAQPPQPRAPETPTREQDLDAARASIKANLAAMSKTEVKTHVEPSFVFKPLT